MQEQTQQTIPHGGNLNEAVKRFGRPREEWLDLSTGINPHPYPAPQLPPDAWHRLPEQNEALAQAAQTYYNAPQMLPVAGTQAAIQALPLCRMRSSGVARVAAAAPSYAEHAHRWTQAGHRVAPVAYEDLDSAVADADVVLLCNPNNPTGATVAPDRLLEWRGRLAARGGWLVVDEAFGDAGAHGSVAPSSAQPGLIVLRSVGKFFGLAGLRLGFVAAEPALLAMLAAQLGPWSVSGPAQQIGCAALSDKAWQQATKTALAAAGARLHALLQRHGVSAAGTDLYRWWPWPAQRAHRFWLHMAQRGVWVRLFEGAAPGIRVGLPADEDGWRRLADGLAAWAAQAEAA
jgi:cobalamin biosynthetic protein CobC